MKKILFVFSTKNVLLVSIIAVILLLTTSIFLPVNVCEANTPTPPSILIIVPYAPDDMKISIVPDNIEAERINRAYESYFTFYLYDMKSDVYTIRVTTEEKSYDTVFRIKPNSYNNVYILDRDKEIFTAGVPESRGITLATLRIVLTLFVEGLVFWFFGYRQKKSWVIFLIINLITQGILNLLLNTSGNPLSSYLIFILLFAEILIIVVEMILFLIFVRENTRLATVFYVMCANVFSLIVGGLLITVLPV